MDVYPKVRKLASSAEAALKFCRKHYPDTAPVILSSEISDFSKKMFYWIELRPIEQQSLNDFGGVPHGTE